MPGISWRRLRGLVWKETLQAARDPSSLLIALVMPLILLLLFGYGVSLDARHVRVGLVIETPSRPAESFAASFGASPYFDVVLARDRNSMEKDLVAGRLRGIVVLRADFERELAAAASGRGPAPIQVIVDGTDANTARLVEGYVDGAWNLWLAQTWHTERQASPRAVRLEPRVWFNPELKSRNFLVPGLIAVIMTLIGTLLTALVVAREWERGTMEALLATPVTVAELLLGKLIPYFGLGMLGMGLAVALAVGLYDVPMRGSFLVLSGVSALFLLGALGLGLLISTLARNQFVAGQIALFAGFLPSYMLSGFLFDIGSMPPPIQVMTHVVAARYFVSSLQTLFLAGNLWSVILPDALAMAVIAAVLLGLTVRLTARRIG
ncbi:MAG: ABC transporter permease [Alphaproteobacteria bacterium]